MRRYVLALAATALVATTGLALADEKIGKIVKIDLPRDELQVENVQVKIEGAKIEGAKIVDFKAGDTVRITFDQQLDSFVLQTLERQ